MLHDSSAKGDAFLFLPACSSGHKRELMPVRRQLCVLPQMSSSAGTQHGWFFAAPCHQPWHLEQSTRSWREPAFTKTPGSARGGTPLPPPGTWPPAAGCSPGSAAGTAARGGGVKDGRRGDRGAQSSRVRSSGSQISAAERAKSGNAQCSLASADRASGQECAAPPGAPAAARPWRAGRRPLAPGLAPACTPAAPRRRGGGCRRPGRSPHPPGAQSCKPGGAARRPNLVSTTLRFRACEADCDQPFTQKRPAVPVRNRVHSVCSASKQLKAACCTRS